MPKPVTADSLAALEGIAHGFFTRHGGVSQGIYTALNCGLGSQDDPGAVRENRARVAVHMGARSLITAHQVHGTTALVAEEAWPQDARPKADAIVTAKRGLAVGVMTADCTPVAASEAAKTRPRVITRARASVTASSRPSSPSGVAVWKPCLGSTPNSSHASLCPSAAALL